MTTTSRRIRSMTASGMQNVEAAVFVQLNRDEIRFLKLVSRIDLANKNCIDRHTVGRIDKHVKGFCQLRTNELQDRFLHFHGLRLNSENISRLNQILSDVVTKQVGLCVI